MSGRRPPLSGDGRRVLAAQALRAFAYGLGALLLGLAAERFVTLRSFGIDWRLLVATGALLFVTGAAMMLAAAGLFRRLGTNVPPSQPTTLIATTGCHSPYVVTTVSNRTSVTLAAFVNPVC